MKAALRRVGLGLLCVLMLAQGADMALRPDRYTKGHREEHREPNSKARAMQSVLWMGADEFGARPTGAGLGVAAGLGLVGVWRMGARERRRREAYERA